jgi:hypothetical protein
MLKSGKGEENILWKENRFILPKHQGRLLEQIHSATKESMPYHIEAARNAILHYIHETGKADFVDGKMIFLQGSQFWKKKHGINLVDCQNCSSFYSQISTKKTRLQE